MTIKSDPLTVLLSVRKEMATSVDEELLRACYQMQSEHQHDKERDTVKKMHTLVEAMIEKSEGDVLL